VCPACQASTEHLRRRLREEVDRLRELRKTSRQQLARLERVHHRLAQSLERARRLLEVRGERPLTVLVVDDEPDVREAIRLFLEPLGSRVVVAPDGEAGLAAAMRESPDLVLTDLRMPRLDGWELVRRLRETPGLAATPVVAISAFVTPQDAGPLERAGFDGWLEKPFEPEALFRVLDEARRRLSAA
jgi:two-component system cell cycle response regulator DivK